MFRKKIIAFIFETIIVVLLYSYIIIYGSMTNNQENFLLLELCNVGFVSIIFLLSPKLLMILIL